MLSQPTSLCFHLFLICNENSQHKGLETCQEYLFVGEIFWGIMSTLSQLFWQTAAISQVSHGAAPFWYCLQSLLPLQIMRWLQNVAEECELNPKQDGAVSKAYEQYGLWALRGIQLAPIHPCLPAVHTPLSFMRY